MERQEATGGLRREVGLPGAVMMGLGSIVGTGVFVSLGLAAGLAGWAMLGALLLAAGLALCNGLSTAQLAAAHPVSGGTYEYGSIYIHPWVGYMAGWLFLSAKSASAATAAIGFGHYLWPYWQLLLGSLGSVGGVASARSASGVRLAGSAGPADASLADAGLAGSLDLPVVSGAPWQLGLVALALVVTLSLLGIRRSSWANGLIVSVTLMGLGIYVLALAPELWTQLWTAAGSTTQSPTGGQSLLQALGSPASSSNGSDGNGSSAPGGPPLRLFLEATALMFVAYTGYGRVATLGAEIKNPARNIPRAVGWSLALACALYLLVAAVSLAAAGAEGFYQATVAGASGGPLQAIALAQGQPVVAHVVALAALTAMLGVLLNLVLGLSRVMYAMSLRGDLPRALGQLGASASPTAAIAASGVLIGLMVLALKQVQLAWSFSAFTVLLYYSITNVSALRLPRRHRLYHPLWAWLGLVGCLSLGFWVDPSALALGLALLLVGLLWRLVFRRAGS